MGAVFVAEDRELRRQVALKVLSDRMALDPQHQQRFQREARALAALSHPNIVTIYSVEHEDELHFLTMEMVEGKPLDQVIPAEGLELEELLHAAVCLAEALSAAHAQGVMHRDLKPANVMVGDAGEIKVLDFGLAKLRQEHGGLDISVAAGTLTQTGVVMGTVPYMSPEQVEGKPADHRTDIFSLGIILYEMATGERPFQGDTAPALMSSILKDEPASVTRLRPRLPARLAQIIDRCLEKDPAQRYPDADAMARELSALQGAVAQHPTLVSSLSTLSALLPRTRRWRLAAIASAVGILALIAVALNYETLEQRWQAPAEAPEISSLAVLPFTNLSGDEEQDYLAAGMTEILITELSKIEDLKVISSNSSGRFQETDQPLAEIAKELSVEAVVEGSLLRSGDQVRVTAQLVHAESDFQLWADSFERSLQDILVLQGELAQAIAHQVRVSLTPQTLARLEGFGAVSPKAVELYLKGLNSGIWGRIELFQQAIAEEPEFAQAHAALANAYAGHGWIGWPYSPEDAYGPAREAAARALQIDPNLAEGHIAQGLVAIHFDWDWEAAERSFRRAVELDPGNVYALIGVSSYLAAMGRVDEAVSMAERARELDPLSVWSNVQLCQMLYFARQFDRGLDQLHQRWEAQNGMVHHMRWQLLNATGDLEAAAGARLIYEAQSGSPEPVVEIWRKAFTEDGATGFWRAFIKGHEMTPKELYWAVDVAKAHVQIGQLDEALAALETAFERRRSKMAYLGVDPMWDPLRSDPRFQDLLIRMKLPQAREPGIAALLD